MFRTLEGSAEGDELVDAAGFVCVEEQFNEGLAQSVSLTFELNDEFLSDVLQVRLVHRDSAGLSEAEAVPKNPPILR